MSKSPPRPPLRKAAGARLAAALLIAGLPNAALRSEEPVSRPVMQAAAPAGFETLAQAQVLVVDIHIGGTKRGVAEIRAEPGLITFLDPAGLLPLLPPLNDVQAVQLALASSLPSHPELVCSPGADRAECGRLAAPIIGVIFDEERFRLDIFLGSSVLAPQGIGAAEYLDFPDRGLSVLNRVGLVLSGSKGTAPAYNLQNRLIMGDAGARLRAELSYASEFGVQADRIVAEVDSRASRYRAGVFWTPGSDFIDRRKILGVGFETQTDTRLDRDALYGSPLVVFLRERSKVDIYRDGRLISSATYEPGNRAIDTTSLPDGSYAITLRIEEFSGSVIEQKRYFTKVRQIAAVGKINAFASAGLVADERRSSFLSLTDTPFAQAGAMFRISSVLAVEGTGALSDDEGVFQASGYLFSPAGVLRAGVLLSSDKTRAGLIQLISPGNSRLNYSFAVRHVDGNDQDSLLAGNLAVGLGPAERRSIAPSQVFTHVSGTISYDWAPVQLYLAGYMRSEGSGRTIYSFGPSLRWDLLRRDPFSVSLDGDYTRTDTGLASFAGISVRMARSRSSATASGGMRKSPSHPNPGRSPVVGALGVTWQDGDPTRQELALSGSYAHDLGYDLVSGSASVRGRSFSTGGSISGGSSEGVAQLQYGMDFSSTLAISGEHATLEGRGDSESAVIVTSDASDPDLVFEVLVNDGSVGTVRAGKPLTVALPAYRRYEVRVRPTGAARIDYDSAARMVSLYPGTVARLRWSGRRITPMFGRILDPGSGQPVAYALLSLAGGSGQTNGDGYFMVEGVGSGALEVLVAGRPPCHIELPARHAENGYVALGDLSCRNPTQGDLFP